MTRVCVWLLFVLNDSLSFPFSLPPSPFFSLSLRPCLSLFVLPNLSLNAVSGGMLVDML